MSKVLFQFAACGSQTLVCQVVADHVPSNLCCQLGEWRYGLLTYIDCIICSKVLNAVDVVLGKLAIHLWEEE